MILLARNTSRRMQHVDGAGVLGQVGRLLDGRIAAADDDQRLVAEARQRTVADGAGADAAVLVLLLGRQAQVVGPRAGGDDDRVRLVRLAFERLQLEGLLAEIDVDDVVGDDPRAEVDRPAAASGSSAPGR